MSEIIGLTTIWLCTVGLLKLFSFYLPVEFSWGLGTVIFITIIFLNLVWNGGSNDKH